MHSGLAILLLFARCQRHNAYDFSDEPDFSNGEKYRCDVDRSHGASDAAGYCRRRPETEAEHSTRGRT